MKSPAQGRILKKPNKQKKILLCNVFSVKWTERINLGTKIKENQNSAAKMIKLFHNCANNFGKMETKIHLTKMINQDQTPNEIVK